MSDPKSWLQKQALDAAFLIYTGKLGLTNDAQEECEGFSYVIEAVAREFAERALHETLQSEYSPDSGKITVHAHFPSGPGTCDCFSDCGNYETYAEADARIEHLVQTTIEEANR